MSHKAMKVKTYQYRAKPNSDELVIANDGDALFAGVFHQIEEELSHLRTLNRLDYGQIYPIYWVETEEQKNQRKSFSSEEWIIAACMMKGDNIKNVLIVNRKNHNNAYVIDFKKLAVYYSIFNSFMVEEGNGFMMAEDFLQSIHAVEPRDEIPQIEEDEDEFVMPDLSGSIRFESHSKRKIPNISATPSKPIKPGSQEAPVEPAPIQNPQPVFKAGKKTKIPNLGNFNQPSKPAPQQKPKLQPVPNKSPQPVFAAGKKKKIPNLGDVDQTPGKPTPDKPEDDSAALEAQQRVLAQAQFQATKKRDFNSPPVLPTKKPKTPQKHDKQVIKSEFTPASKKTPPIIGDEIFFHRVFPTLKFLQLQRKTNSKTIYRSEFHIENEPIFQRIEDSLSSVKRFVLTRQTIFTPSLFEPDDPFFDLIAAFDLSKWRMLCANVDAMNHPYSVALSYLEKPEICLLINLEKRPEVTCVSKIGFIIPSPYREFQDILDICNRKPVMKPEPALPIEPELSQEEEEDTVVEEDLPIVEEENKISISDFVIKKRAKPQRRLFVTEMFRRDFSSFESVHPKAREDFDELCEKLVCNDENSLIGFLSSRDSKNLLGITSWTFHKFRFSNAGEYYGARVFYINGYDTDRKMDASSIILVGISNEDEHDDQQQVGYRIASYLDAHSEDLILHEILMPEDKDEEPEEVAYLSKEQVKLLEESSHDFPVAFCGSAGTGKTLMSISKFIELYQNGRVLYVTYQEDLCDYVYKTLENFGVEEPDCLTFRGLCGRLFSNDVGIVDKHCGRAEFREWFFNQHNMNSSFRTLTSPLGDSPDEKFMTAYVFYNGIISGSLACMGHPSGRLTKNEFLKKTNNEEGYDRQARESAHKVAELYDRYLKENDYFTDNDLARMIIQSEKKLNIYDSIIIDEYQDLSELQFRAILTLFRNTNPLPLFIYGDDNQAVNPTIFNCQQATSITMNAFASKPKMHVVRLNESYRSGNSLVRFINEYNIIKRDCIGAAKRLNEEPEVSRREDDDDLLAVLIREEPTFRQAVQLAAKSDRDTVFVFPEAKIRDLAIEEYKDLNPQFVESSFLSVEQAKGREWDTVVLANFFSSSASLFARILGEEKAGKHSTLHRMLFNRFYVALTRAKNRIIVYESDSNEIIDERILSHLAPLPNLDELKSYFAGEVNQRHWMAFGDRLFKKKDYEGALRAYGRISELPAARAKIEKTKQYLRAQRKQLSAKEVISMYIRYDDLQGLRDYYWSIGASLRHAFLSAFLDSEPIDSMSESYQECIEECDEEEKTVFFYLACLRLEDEISRITRG